MNNLFTRMKNVFTADLHEMLDQKEQKNPIALLNQYLRECEQEVEKVRKLISRQHLLRDEFTREYNMAKSQAEKRKYQAEVALKAEEKDLYEFIVREQLQYEDRATRIKESLDNTTRQLSELEMKYEEMKHKLKDYSIKRMELMGRENTARAESRMNHVLQSSRYEEDPFSRFGELESYIDRLENKVKSDEYRNTIDSRIQQLEKQVKNNETHSIS